jgi:hypothetical protein
VPVGIVPHKTLVEETTAKIMGFTRRMVLSGVVVGTGGFLAGCTAGQSGSESTAGTTATSGGSIPEATSGMTSTTESATETTDSPTEQPEPLTAGSSTERTEPPRAPTSPTTIEIVSRSGVLTVIEIEVGPPGNDPRSIYEEHIDFENIGEESLSVAGYTVEYGRTGKSYEFSDRTRIDAGGTFRLTTGNGGETIMPGENEAFAGFEMPMLANGGGSITVTDASGRTALEVNY